MDPDNKILTIFIKKIDELQAERQRIDDKIVSLDLAFETLAGHPRENGKRKKKAPGYSLDRKAQPRTLAFLIERKRPVTVAAVAEKFKIQSDAASQRLSKLVAKGEAVRVAPGKYVAVPKATNGN